MHASTSLLLPSLSPSRSHSFPFYTRLPLLSAPANPPGCPLLDAVHTLLFDRQGGCQRQGREKEGADVIAHSQKERLARLGRRRGSASDGGEGAAGCRMRAHAKLAAQPGLPAAARRLRSGGAAPAPNLRTDRAASCARKLVLQGTGVAAKHVAARARGGRAEACARRR